MLQTFIRIAISLGIILSAVMITIFLFGFRPKPKSAADDKIHPLVEVVEVSSHAGDLKISTNGIVEPFREITISAEVDGKITEKSEIARAGRYVKKGDPLLEIDKQDYELEKRRAEAEVKQADLQINETNEELASAKELLELAKEDEKIQEGEYTRRLELKDALSRAELDQTKRAVIAARNARIAQENQIRVLTQRIARLKQTLELANNGLEKAVMNVNRAVIKAEMDGLLVSDMCEKGDFVQRGTNLFQFEDTSAAEVSISLRPDQLQLILESKLPQPISEDPDKPNDPNSRFAYEIPELDASIRLNQNGAENLWNGKLYRFDGTGINETTRTTSCRIKVADRISIAETPRPLRRGMYVDVELTVKTKNPVLSLPSEAVRPGNEVWLIEEKEIDGKKASTLRKIKIDLITNQQTKDGEVALFWVDENSPKIGDKIISSPLTAPPNGLQVRLSDEPSKSSEKDSNETESTDSSELDSTESSDS